MEIAKVYPLDAVYDIPEDVPEDVMLIIYDVFVVIPFHALWTFCSCCRLKPTKDMLVLQTGLLRLAIMCLFPHQAASMLCYDLLAIQCLISMFSKSSRKLLKLWRMILAALISSCILSLMVLRLIYHQIFIVVTFIATSGSSSWPFLLSTQKVTKPLLETSRRGYLAAISASSYSFVSLLQHFLPIMNPGNVSYMMCLFCFSTDFPFSSYAICSVLF